MNFRTRPKYRHELKYTINFQDYQLLKIRLKNLLQKDIHVNTDGIYTIRSLYFEDFFNSAYNEKYMGIKNRQKFRIRIYNYSDDVIRLERKIKTNRYIHKETSLITRDDVKKILSGDYSFLLKSENNLNRLFYYECVSNLARPRVLVDYEREPFIFDTGDVRINFDTNIRAGVDIIALFNDSLAMLDVLDEGELVMEVKYTEFLPSMIRNLLPSRSSEYTAMSKYVLCCDKTLYNRRSDY